MMMVIGKTSKKQKRRGTCHLGRVRGGTVDGSSRRGEVQVFLAGNVQRIQPSLARGSLKWQPSIINCFRESSPDQLLGKKRPAKPEFSLAPRIPQPTASNQQTLTNTKCTEPERNELDTTEFVLRKSENMHHISRGVQAKYISID